MRNMIGKMRVVILFVLLISVEAMGQGLDVAGIEKRLETQGEVLLKQSNCVILKFDYFCDSNSVEAVVVRPADEGRYPAILWRSL